MPEIAVPKVYGETGNKFKVSLPKSRLVTKGDWKEPVRLENMPIAIYDEKGDLKEVVTRTGRPVDSGGIYWAFKYRGEWFTTLLDPIFKCGQHKIGGQKPMRKGGSYA
jgi:hypothetical protein